LYLKADPCNLILLELVILNDVCQSPSLHELHNDPELSILDEKGLDEVNDVRVMRFLHDDDLVDDELLSRLLSEIHLFDRDLAAVVERFGDEDHSRRSVKRRVESVFVPSR
jgi:hypothetical protein